MPQHSPAAITPSILPLYVGLRSQLSLDASSLASSDDFITAVDLVGAARHSFKTSFDLQSFLRNVGGFDKNLNDRILGLSPDTIIRDERVIGAWAELLSLRKLPHPQLGYSEEAVWSAVDHLVSIATIATIATHPARNDTETSPADAQPDTLSGSKAIGSPFTPHKRPPEPPDDTPVHANSGLHFSTSLQECARVDSYLRTELRDTVLKDVGGFSTFFNGITETEWACAISCPPKCACQWPAHNDCVREIELAPILRVPGFPSTRNPSQHSVLEWFANFNQVVSSPRGFYHSPTRPLSHSHSSSKRQCDLFLATRSASAALANNTHAWPNVLVPIELKASPLEDCTSDTIVQLASYVREVFGAQINRRFVHAFAICGPFFRCYLFDRAGVSISQRLCISKNDKTQALFARILVGYMRMSAQELGFDTHYLYPENNQPDGPVSFMPTPLAPKPQYLLFDGRKFRLEKPLFHRAVIVSRGTLCWLGEDVDTGEQCVIKDSWRASWRTSEGKLLALAGDRGVLGIAHPVVYGDVKLDSDNDQVDSIVSLRSGLSYSSATRVIIPTKPLDGVYFLSSTKCVPVNTETTTSAKRRSGEQLGSEHRKTAKLNSSNQTPTTGASRSVTKSQTRSQASHTSLIGEAVTPGTTTQYSTRVDPSCPPGGYMQLTHSVIVTSPIGERIEKFRSIRELLEAFRDAIRCHQSLVESGGILHRDISPNNIMINRSQPPSSPKGFLIDLDLAKELPPCISPPTTPSSLRRRTGTMFFMAIEILKATAPRHSWRHDLESFLYVLIWLCVCCPDDSDANSRTLLEACWSEKAADNNKLVQMSQKADWERLMGWFAPSMGERMPRVARGMRDVLFPAVKGEMGVEIGTGSNRGGTYAAVLAVLETEIASLPDEE